MASTDFPSLEASVARGHSKVQNFSNAQTQQQAISTHQHNRSGGHGNMRPTGHVNMHPSMHANMQHATAQHMRIEDNPKGRHARNIENQNSTIHDNYIDARRDSHTHRTTRRDMQYGMHDDMRHDTRHGSARMRLSAQPQAKSMNTHQPSRRVTINSTDRSYDENDTARRHRKEEKNESRNESRNELRKSNQRIWEDERRRSLGNASVGNASVGNASVGNTSRLFTHSVNLNCGNATNQAPSEGDKSDLKSEELRKFKPMKLQFWRTKMCPWVLSLGHCRKGAGCRYAHTEQELRPLPDLSKTKMCDEFEQTGKCPDRRRCKYAHSAEELRATTSFSKTKLCPMWLQESCSAGSNCRFAHGEFELRSHPPVSDDACSVDTKSRSSVQTRRKSDWDLSEYNESQKHGEFKDGTYCDVKEKRQSHPAYPSHSNATDPTTMFAEFSANDNSALHDASLHQGFHQQTAAFAANNQQPNANRNMESRGDPQQRNQQKNQQTNSGGNRDERFNASSFNANSFKDNNLKQYVLMDAMQDDVARSGYIAVQTATEVHDQYHVPQTDHNRNAFGREEHLQQNREMANPNLSNSNLAPQKYWPAESAEASVLQGLSPMSLSVATNALVYLSGMQWGTDGFMPPPQSRGANASANAPQTPPMWTVAPPGSAMPTMPTMSAMADTQVGTQVGPQLYNVASTASPLRRAPPGFSPATTTTAESGAESGRFVAHLLPSGIFSPMTQRSFRAAATTDYQKDQSSVPVDLFLSFPTTQESRDAMHNQSMHNQSMHNQSMQQHPQSMHSQSMHSQSMHNQPREFPEQPRSPTIFFAPGSPHASPMALFQQTNGVPLLHMSNGNPVMGNPVMGNQVLSNMGNQVLTWNPHSSGNGMAQAYSFNEGGVFSPPLGTTNAPVFALSSASLPPGVSRSVSPVSFATAVPLTTGEPSSTLGGALASQLPPLPTGMHADISHARSTAPTELPGFPQIAVLNPEFQSIAYCRQSPQDSRQDGRQEMQPGCASYSNEAHIVAAGEQNVDGQRAGAQPNKEMKYKEMEYKEYGKQQYQEEHNNMECNNMNNSPPSTAIESPQHSPCLFSSNSSSVRTSVGSPQQDTKASKFEYEETFC